MKFRPDGSCISCGERPSTIISIDPLYHLLQVGFKVNDRFLTAVILQVRVSIHALISVYTVEHHRARAKVEWDIVSYFCSPMGNYWCTHPPLLDFRHPDRRTDRWVVRYYRIAKETVFANDGSQFVPMENVINLEVFWYRHNLSSYPAQSGKIWSTTGACLSPSYHHQSTAGIKSANSSATSGNACGLTLPSNGITRTLV